MKSFLAELTGTFMLVAVAAGVAGAAAAGSGAAGSSGFDLALATGLAAMAMGFAVGGQSGGHFNPVVSLGQWAAGRFGFGDALRNILAQIVGAVAAGFVLAVIGHLGGEATGPNEVVNLAANGFGPLSPRHFPMVAAALAELLGSALLAFVAAGAVSDRQSARFAPLAIGMAYAVLLWLTMPITGGALNPARATGTALFAGTAYASQLWLFWIVPVIGAILGGLLGRIVESDDSEG